ncbi:MAG: NAD(P)-dependent alcohol dehydrogenase, partial [Candidatus Nitrosopolaris sp.]
ASTFPMIPGHEIAGIVTGVGSKATRYQIGDRVAVGCFVDSCRKCGPCRQGLEQYCTEGPTLTYNSLERDGQTRTQGGYSDKIVVDEDYILRLADNVSLDRAAPLLCAGITMYSPLIHWNACPGKKVGIIGLGGLGHMGVKIADALGSEVSVLSHSLKKQEDGLKMGADKFYATSDHETFKNLRGYFDLIINTLAIEIQWDDYLNLLDLNGTMVVVGIPEKQTPINPATLIMARRSLAGSVIGGIRETQEMLDFCSKHNISSDIEVTPIQKVNEAYERVVKSDVRYRFVIDMKSL